MDSLHFGFTPAIREEDEGNTVLLEIAEGFAGPGKGIGAAEEDAIDTGDLLDLYVTWGGGWLEYTQMRMQSPRLWARPERMSAGCAAAAVRREPAVALVVGLQLRRDCKASSLI